MFLFLCFFLQITDFFRIFLFLVAFFRFLWIRLCWTGSLFLHQASCFMVFSCVPRSFARNYIKVYMGFYTKTQTNRRCSSFSSTNKTQKNTKHCKTNSNKNSKNCKKTKNSNKNTKTLKVFILLVFWSLLWLVEPAQRPMRRAARRWPVRCRPGGGGRGFPGFLGKKNQEKTMVFRNKTLRKAMIFLIILSKLIGFPVFLFFFFPDFFFLRQVWSGVA